MKLKGWSVPTFSEDFQYELEVIIYSKYIAWRWMIHFFFWCIEFFTRTIPSLENLRFSTLLTALLLNLTYKKRKKKRFVFSQFQISSHSKTTRGKVKLEQLPCKRFLHRFETLKLCRNCSQSSCSNFSFSLNSTEQIAALRKIEL